MAKVDIARINLLCASGLPGAAKLDEQAIRRYLTDVDRWAEKVAYQTERHLYRLTDPRFKDHAEHYGHSEARFRAEWLVNVLQQDIGVHYHKNFVPADVAMPRFTTSKETFIHGLLDHEDPRQAFGGNCVSLPVIYAAVGRRLGCPIKLINSKEHVFCRWLGEDHANPVWRDTFNFDGAGEGFSIDPDEFYMSWPRPSTQKEVEIYDWFKPLTPQQEVSLFLLQRGHILRHVNRDYAAAQAAFARAYRYWPTNRNTLIWLNRATRELQVEEFAARPEDSHPQAGSRPWWQTPQGRAANFAEMQRINEINRRNMQRLHPNQTFVYPKPMDPRDLAGLSPLLAQPMVQNPPQPIAGYPQP